MGKPFVSSLVSPIASSLPSSLIGDNGAAISALKSDANAYWNLNEASGNRVDSGPNGYTLTDVNTVGSAAGVGGGQIAADFIPANSERLTALAAASPQPSAAGSFESGIWVIADAAAPTALGWGANKHRLDVNVGSNTIFRTTNAADSGATQVVGAAISVSTWAFISFGYDADAGNLFIGINNGALTTASLVGGMLTGLNMTVGVRGDLLNYWDGRIQAYGFWNRRLSAEERTRLYNGGTAALLYADL